MATTGRTIHDGDVKRAPDVIGRGLTCLANLDPAGCYAGERPRLHGSDRLRTLRLRLLLQRLEYAEAQHPEHVGAASRAIRSDVEDAGRGLSWAGLIAGTIAGGAGCPQAAAAPPRSTEAVLPSQPWSE